MGPLVSILIPAYNAECSIADTLRSALGQSWPSKEIIVVDDGSRDRTCAIAAQFKGVSVISQKNQGAAAARNKAFSASRGDYIQWLDADDLLAPEKIQLQVSVAQSAPSRHTLFSAGWGHFNFRPRCARFKASALWCNLTATDWLLRKLDGNLHMQTATWLVSRELTELAGPWNTALLGDDDGEYFCRVLLKSAGVRFVPEAKVYYRRSVGSLSQIGRSDRKMEAQFASMELHIRYLRSLEDSERVRSACVKYLQRYLIYFYPERSDLVERAQDLASSLGGRLEPPTLSWKYFWIQKAFGWKLAKQAWIGFPRLRESFVRHWDKALFSLEGKELRL